MKKLIFTFLIGLITMHQGWAQEDQEHRQRTSEPAALPQEPQKQEKKSPAHRLEAMPLGGANYGALLIDWGFNFLRECPPEMKKKAFDARSLNVSAYYNIPLAKSHFVISPGIGVGFEGYRFSEQPKSYNTLGRDPYTRRTVFKEALVLLPGTDILRSTLDVGYLDSLLELRFNTNSKYPKEGFFAAIGGNLGMRWKASTTINYKEDDQVKSIVTRESFNLNKMRYGVHARAGWGRFAAFYAHTLSNLFNKEKGPVATTTKPSTAGLSIDLF